MLVDACPDRLSFPAFLTHLETGLKVRSVFPAFLTHLETGLKVRSGMIRLPAGLHGYYLSCGSCVADLVGPGVVTCEPATWRC